MFIALCLSAHRALSRHHHHWLLCVFIHCKSKQVIFGAIRMGKSREKNTSKSESGLALNEITNWFRCQCKQETAFFPSQHTNTQLFPVFISFPLVLLLTSLRPSLFRMGLSLIFEVGRCRERIGWWFCSTPVKSSCEEEKAKKKQHKPNSQSWYSSGKSKMRALKLFSTFIVIRSVLMTLIFSRTNTAAHQRSSKWHPDAAVLPLQTHTHF